MAFVDSGQHESVKGAIHGGVLILLLICFIYNLAAWWKRRDRRLLINLTVYLVLIVFELFQVLRHCTKEVV